MTVFVDKRIVFAVFVIKNLYPVSLQPSLLAMALLCYEAQEQHDPEYTDKIPEALKSLQQQLNVSTSYLYSRCSEFNNSEVIFFL